MRIGSLTLTEKTVLAPLAGITNLPFRLLVKRNGCGLVCSEMVSANGLAHASPKTVRLMETDEAERPVSIQIFGREPAMMAEAARQVEAAGADVIDINFGCSVRKIVKGGAGVALMREPETAEAVLKAVRRATQLPFTIKIRTGWDPSGEEALALARMAEDCGVDAIAVHPRTANQGFRGCADWRLIGAVKAAVSIPVIGNGDIVTPEDGPKMMAATGCDAVMVGRAAVSNPWIFSQIDALTRGGQCEEITHVRRFEAMIAYLRASVRHIGEKHACRMMRSRLGWFSKGMPGGKYFRESITRVSTEAEAVARIYDYMTELGIAPPDDSSEPKTAEPAFHQDRREGLTATESL